MILAHLVLPCLVNALECVTRFSQHDNLMKIDDWGLSRRHDIPVAILDCRHEIASFGCLTLAFAGISHFPFFFFFFLEAASADALCIFIPAYEFFSFGIVSQMLKRSFGSSADSNTTFYINSDANTHLGIETGLSLSLSLLALSARGLFSRSVFLF